MRKQTSVALPILKILKQSSHWMYITDVRGIIDLGNRDEQYVNTDTELEIYGGDSGPARILDVTRIDGDYHYAFRAKKIYLCCALTGSTIDCLL